ncbi:MAG: sulfurtransferase, partial [Rhodobacteraceae bacterium]|nr:sulfurtransferase [Paracoccaceae bacterium]
MDRRSFLAATAALAALSALPAAPARAAGPALPGPLVSAEWLRANLDTPGLVIVDIRGAGPDDLFAAGHVPGAV